MIVGCLLIASIVYLEQLKLIFIVFILKIWILNELDYFCTIRSVHWFLFLSTDTSLFYFCLALLKH